MEQLIPKQCTIILAIESSCDDTCASVIVDGIIKSNTIANQKVHELYGGVVPEMASRAHMEKIVPVVSVALKQAGISKNQLSAIAYTKAPGLIGSLLVGSSFAKSMAQALAIPMIGVHHMQAHILAHFIDDPKPSFPFLCLTVSGGHTQLVVCKDYNQMKVVGSTLDDAAGEAFDKAAKMLGFPYPGGPMIDKYAKDGKPLKYKFPISNMEGYNFSFSGIKTSILNFLKKEKTVNENFIAENQADICASIQYTIIQMLMKKLEQCAADFQIKNIGIAGGVSANSGLRLAVTETGEKKGWNVYIPKFEYCTDNAAMIAITAHYKYLDGDFSGLNEPVAARADLNDA